jgi:hypothetical protein
LYLLRTLGVMSVPIIDFIQLRNVINTPFSIFYTTFCICPGPSGSHTIGSYAYQCLIARKSSNPEHNQVISDNLRTSHKLQML